MTQHGILHRFFRAGQHDGADGRGEAVDGDFKRRSVMDGRQQGMSGLAGRQGWGRGAVAGRELNRYPAREAVNSPDF